MITVVLRTVDKNNHEVWDNDTLIASADWDTAIEFAAELARRAGEGLTLKSLYLEKAEIEDSIQVTVWRDGGLWHYAEDTDEVCSFDSDFHGVVCSLNDKMVERNPENNFAIEFAII